MRPVVGPAPGGVRLQNVTWTGIREVLFRNTQVRHRDGRPTYPTEIISLKCFYGFQMTVDEHAKRVLRGDLAAAGRLERKWADYMQANEEAGAAGAGVRRRRRRAPRSPDVTPTRRRAAPPPTAEGGGRGPPALAPSM